MALESDKTPKKTEPKASGDLTGKPTAGPVPAVADSGDTELTQLEVPERTDPKLSVFVDSAEAHTDRVATVSRDKNGNPDQSSDFELIVPDSEKDAALNKPEDNQVDLPVDNSDSSSKV